MVIMIMNFEYILLISLNAMQIKASSDVAYDFSVCLCPALQIQTPSLPRPVPPRKKNLPLPSLVSGQDTH